jgi:hypothetical protein
MQKKVPLTTSPTEQALNTTATKQLTGQNTQLSNADTTVGKAENTLAGTAPFLSNLTSVGPSGESPLYNSLLQQTIKGTNSAYDNAKVNARQSALQSGLQNQPLTNANEDAIDTQRAGALAQAPQQAELASIQPGLQAAGLSNQQAGLQSGLAGVQTQGAQVMNPSAYSGQGAGLDQTAQMAQLQQQLQQNSALGGLLKGLAGLANPFASAAAAGTGIFK